MLGVAQVVRPVDDVLAAVVDVGRASGGERRSARLAHRAGRHQCAARSGGLAEAELAGGVDDHVDPVGVDAELLRRDLQRHGVHALAHLGPAVADLDASVVRPEPHDRPAHLAEAVAEAGVLEPEAEPDRLAGGERRVVIGPDLVEAGLGAAGSRRP